MITLAFGERSMKSSTIGTNVALEARPYGACSSHPLSGWLLTSLNKTKNITSRPFINELKKRPYNP